jgi:endonuclease/exonuclease/phosphatase family metal-dependent hydrolase
MDFSIAMKSVPGSVRNYSTDHRSSVPQTSGLLLEFSGTMYTASSHAFGASRRFFRWSPSIAFGSGRALIKMRPYVTRLTRVASDHLPLVATVDIGRF